MMPRVCLPSPGSRRAWEKGGNGSQRRREGGRVERNAHELVVFWGRPGGATRKASRQNFLSAVVFPPLRVFNLSVYLCMLKTRW